MPAKKKSRKQVEGYPPRKAGRVSESHYLFRRMRAGEPAAESGFVKTAAGETEGNEGNRHIVTRQGGPTTRGSD